MATAALNKNVSLSLLITAPIIFCDIKSYISAISEFPQVRLVTLMMYTRRILRTFYLTARRVQISSQLLQGL